MASVKLTERCNIFLNTSMEKHVLLLLLSKNEISSVRIWDQYIYLFSDPNNYPDAVQGIKARVMLRYTDDNMNIIEEEANIDVRDVEKQLEDVTLINDDYGDFSYVDWNQEYVTVSTDCNSVIRFKPADIPELNSENTDIWGYNIHPKVENIGRDKTGKFQAYVSNEKITIKITVDSNEYLDSKAVEL